MIKIITIAIVILLNACTSDREKQMYEQQTKMQEILDSIVLKLDSLEKLEQKVDSLDKRIINIEAATK